MKLFIDTNIFLNFYHLSKDDLEELRKLEVLVDDGKLILYLPEQVINKFHRNRDVKLADALKKFKQELLNNQFPQICKEYPEYIEMRRSINKYKKAKSQLLDKLQDDIDKTNLKADHVIEALFNKSECIEITQDILTEAKVRYDLGNPPGKKGSYGDAVNWISLLKNVPDESDIYFVSEDADYQSKVNSDIFSPFLTKEWEQEKNGKIHFFKRLSSFFKEKFPEIDLASELEKSLLIQKLGKSMAFANTRSILKKLSKFTDFSLTEAKAVIEAANSNNQVFWIMEDKDINKILQSIVKGHEDKIDEEALKDFHVKLGILKTEDDTSSIEEISGSAADNDIPF